tara:strand:+ start:3064 stop:4038 length:975 start_codon:yes stop_codon:yes gene_type:complete
MNEEPTAIANDREEGIADQEVVDEVATTPETEEADTEEETSQEGAEEVKAEDDEGDDSEEGDPDDEEYQFDFGGNKFNSLKKGMPKELAEEVQRYGNGLQTSYTKKFTALSEASKIMESRDTAHQKLSTMNNQTLNEYAKGLSLKTEIAELEKIDIDPYLRSEDSRDHLEAQRIQNAIQQKTRQFETHLSNVTQLGHQATEVERQENVRRYTEGVQQMDGKIADFSKKHANDVVAYAVSKGVPEVHAKTWPMNPFAAETTYKAMMWDRAQAKGKKGIQKTTNKITPVIPVGVKKKGKSGGARKDPGKMSSDEYTTWYKNKYGKR